MGDLERLGLMNGEREIVSVNLTTIVISPGSTIGYLKSLLA